jgi:glucose-6-phosphate dehydrogenase assembly protein OpcA
VIVDLPDTTVTAVSKKLVQLRDSAGVVALGRVLTLIIDTEFSEIEEAVAAANGASRLHPARIIVLATEPKGGARLARLDGQIRVGGDAGASEVVVLRAYGAAASNPESLVTGLLLPDAPVVSWWPSGGPENPAETPFGKIAQRRITDSARHSPAFLKRLAKNYHPGDGDMAWTRLTLWRSQLAAIFERHLHREVSAIEVMGSSNSPSADLLAAWLSLRLGVTSQITRKQKGKQIHGIAGVKITFTDGELSIIRGGELAKIQQPEAPDSQVLLPRRSNQDCLIEDMRYLGEDFSYGEVLRAAFQ